MNMYNGKYSGKKRRLLKTRQFVILTSLALLLVGLVGGSLAYLFMSTQSVNNTFTEAYVKTSVQEDKFDGVIKKGVTIQNDGNISAYIRAAVVINWQTEGGVVYGEAPVKGENEDFTISYNQTDWTEQGGFWYYKDAVNAGEETNALINSVQPTDTGRTRTDDAGNTYYFTVTILSSGIQAKGMGAANAQAAWAAAANN